MEEDNNLFIERIEQCNLFTKQEINDIKSSIILYERCYLLGVLDAQEF